MYIRKVEKEAFILVETMILTAVCILVLSMYVKSIIWDIEKSSLYSMNEDLLYMAIEQMEGMNIRRMIVPIRQFIRNNDKPDFAKSLLIELMIDQEIDEDMEVIKKGISYEVNPSYAPMVLNQEEIYKLLMEALEDDNPSLLAMCEQFLNFYLYSIYPKYIDEQDYRSIAGAIHYHLASLQYIDIELEDIEYLYNCDQEEVKDVLETIQSIEY